MKIIMSLKYEITFCNPSSTVSIKWINVAGGVFMPKGITINWNCPNGVTKADFSLVSADNGTSQ